MGMMEVKRMSRSQEMLVRLVSRTVITSASHPRPRHHQTSPQSPATSQITIVRTSPILRSSDNMFRTILDTLDMSRTNLDTLDMSRTILDTLDMTRTILDTMDMSLVHHLVIS